jgi:hypothetical protein
MFIEIVAFSGAEEGPQAVDSLGQSAGNTGTEDVIGKVRELRLTGCHGVSSGDGRPATILVDRGEHPFAESLLISHAIDFDLGSGWRVTVVLQ